MKTIEELAGEHFNTLQVNNDRLWVFTTSELEALCKAYMRERLSEFEPFGYFKAEPFGWTDCAEDDEGAVALYEAPQPAIPDGYALVPLKVIPAIEAIYGNEKCIYQTAQDMHDAMIAEAMKGNDEHKRR